MGSKKKGKGKEKRKGKGKGKGKRKKSSDSFGNFSLTIVVLQNNINSWLITLHWIGIKIREKSQVVMGKCEGSRNVKRKSEGSMESSSSSSFSFLTADI